MSSQAGQVGLYGYTAYSPPKFALTGFAQALRMELKDLHKVAVSVCYPPDTDTPQLKVSEEAKPSHADLPSLPLPLSLSPSLPLSLSLSLSLPLSPSLSLSLSLCLCLSSRERRGSEWKWVTTTNGLTDRPTDRRSD